DQVLRVEAGHDLHGGPHDVVMHFHFPVAVSAPLCWKTDTGIVGDVLALLGEEAARQFNIQFQVEVGNALFGFVAEDAPPGTRYVIAARSMSIEYLNPEPPHRRSGI
ncbi:MAG: hypothetical protein R3B72_51380, partial [Polyangiaceae bacterium]